MVSHQSQSIAIATATLSMFAAFQPAFASLDLGGATDYALLGLENGNVIVNSASTVTGDFGCSNGVASTTNAKIGEGFFGEWAGTGCVHSVATFSYSDKDDIPSGCIVTNGTEDARLNQANIDAVALSACVAGLIPTGWLGLINDSSVGVGSANGFQDIHLITNTLLFRFDASSKRI